MTRFNIAALQQQGMSQAEIDAYIRKKEAAIYGPKAGGGTGYDIGAPMPGPASTFPGGTRSDGGTGYDIDAPMPGPASTFPGGTRSDLGKPRLEDIGKPGYSITGPRPPKPDMGKPGPDMSKPGFGENQPDRSIPESDDFQNLLNKRKKRKEEQSQKTPNRRIPRKKTATLEQMAGEKGGSRFQKMLDRIKEISG